MTRRGDREWERLMRQVKGDDRDPWSFMDSTGYLVALYVVAGLVVLAAVLMIRQG